MITFHPITLEDKEWASACMESYQSRNCEYCFGNNLIWQQVYQTEAACIENCFCVRYPSQEKTIYSFPAGADPYPALDKLIAYAGSQTQNWLLYGLSLEQTQEMQKRYPGAFTYHTDRGDSDYLYTVEKLSNLTGKKFHGKRNHIARFMDNPNWQYEPITAANLQEVMDMDLKWFQTFRKYDEEGLSDEHLAIRNTLPLLEEIGLIGGCLRQNGRIVAYSVGEPLSKDTFVVHIEKAFPDVQGAYPMINRQFVLHTCQGYTYVNREEDLGDPGLRRAKLSYQPDMILDKYMAVPVHMQNTKTAVSIV